ncbi:hypothetical protein [Dyadobacter tibetensis]|uniref:hypothetical protein n=1 Tax=Dyadobacter tibetensis TaxID=1211851 RepID=UPI0004718F3E|nr:hypothetical protein [Dyadobacter tibetensis]
MIILNINPLSQPVAISEMVIILALSALIGWWLGRRVGRGKLERLHSEVSELQMAVSDCQQQTEERKIQAMAAVPFHVEDNLKLIEGIGPMIEKLLNNKGIHRFDQLAEMHPDKIAQILVAADSRNQMHNPHTWPEQAALARDGKWDELGELQDRLDGGRRL